MEESNDTSHIPTIQLASLEDEVERNMSEASRKGNLRMPHGEFLANRLIILIAFLPLPLILTNFFMIFGLWGKQLSR